MVGWLADAPILMLCQSVASFAMSAIVCAHQAALTLSGSPDEYAQRQAKLPINKTA